MIRTATIADLPGASAIVKRFSDAVGRRFGSEHFIKFWSVILENDLGAVFLLEQEGAIQGAIGGLAIPDPYHGGMVASEAFWFVLPEYRGGLGGGRLYKAFEVWAVERCCEELQMVHLEALTPERLEEFYLRRGYEKIETRYSKQLQRCDRMEAA